MTEQERKQFATELAASGGKACWAKMSPDERSERAKKMAAARWAKKADGKPRGES